MRGRRPRILFLDAYDSYSNNIIALVKHLIDAEITTIKIDDSRYLQDTAAFEQYLTNFDGVVAGPGPGTANCDKDIGLIARLWTLDSSRTLPVLGICLGFQSLGLAFGGHIERLAQPRHGMVARIEHNDSPLFAGCGNILATQYNSLHVVLDDAHPTRVELGKHRKLYTASTTAPLLQPLAWIADDVDNGPILMGIRHTQKPFWGVQYHPESICTNHAGAQIITNWWNMSQAWLNLKKKSTVHHAKSVDVVSIRELSIESDTDEPKTMNNLSTRESSETRHDAVEWKMMSLGQKTTKDICESLKAHGITFNLLESGTDKHGRSVNSETGRFSIIACDSLQDDEKLEYHISSQMMTHISTKARLHTKMELNDVWDFLASFMKERKAFGGPPLVPFWGGLVGFISYEASLGSIDVSPTTNLPAHSDLCFTFIRRSVVIDHVDKTLYIQSTKEADSQWMISVYDILGSTNSHSPPTKRYSEISISTADFTDTVRNNEIFHMHAEAELRLRLAKASVNLPNCTLYKQKVSQCQDIIRAGNAYELCQTAQSQITLPRPTIDTTLSDWTLYKRLRSSNPAPFGAYLKFSCTNQDITILSSSPERFLSWSRDGTCQFRPIKGTVKKSPTMPYEKAMEILSSDKERAENLMIVDLIRHDLNGVAESGTVQVKKLMVVEEYETVYQLVSVIEGTVKEKSGIDVLRASLPPGSMTGAPKRRACEVLQQIEDGKPRGIYSGVIGYFDAGGGGDFSVVIRTAYNWRDRPSEHNPSNSSGESSTDTWCIGAGGAITIQSSAEAELEEMKVKRQALLNIFRADV